MYCPHCGTELLEPDWKTSPLGTTYSNVTCLECDATLYLEDKRDEEPEAVTVIELH